MKKNKLLKSRIVSELYKDAKNSIDLSDTKDRLNTCAYQIAHMGREYKNDKWEIKYTLFGVKISCNTPDIMLCSYFNYNEWDMIKLNIQVICTSISQQDIKEMIQNEITQVFIDIEMDISRLANRIDKAKIVL